ncbi:MAG: GntR family transcriptional regulator [Nitrososphaerales archaeon]
MITIAQIRQVQDSSTLPEKVAEQLRSLVIKGDLNPGVQLPTEPELSKALNVSRSTLRAALDRLEREGVVIRRRGVGTFVTQQPLVANNLNLNWGVTEVIRSTGATPGIANLGVSLGTADHHIAERLNVEVGEPIVLVERVRLADSRRVVFSRDMFRYDLMKTPEHEFSLAELKRFLLAHQSLYAFLKEKLLLDIHHAMAWLRPMTADDSIADRLEISAGSGLLYIEQVDYDPGGNPIVLADEYHVAEAFTWTVYRTSLGLG